MGCPIVVYLRFHVSCEICFLFAFSLACMVNNPLFQSRKDELKSKSSLTSYLTILTCSFVKDEELSVISFKQKIGTTVFGQEGLSRKKKELDKLFPTQRTKNFSNVKELLHWLTYHLIEIFLVEIYLRFFSFPRRMLV